MPPAVNKKIYNNLKNNYHNFDVKHFKTFTKYNNYGADKMLYEIEMRKVYDRFLECWHYEDPNREIVVSRLNQGVAPTMIMDEQNPTFIFEFKLTGKLREREPKWASKIASMPTGTFH